MTSIVIPAYNEERRIGKTLEKIKQHGKYEIIVVDDGSKDRTAEIAKKHGARVVKNQKNKGKGYSVRRGMLAATHDRVLFTDADLSTPIEELDKVLEVDADIAIGSRNCTGALRVEDQGLMRRSAGRIFNLLTRMITGVKAADTQCGFKLFSKKTIKPIFSQQKLDGFSFDVEILYLAKKLGYKIEEVPVRWHDDKRSTVKMRDSLKMFFDLIRIRVRR